MGPARQRNGSRFSDGDAALEGLHDPLQISQILEKAWGIFSILEFGVQRSGLLLFSALVKSGEAPPRS